MKGILEAAINEHDVKEMTIPSDQEISSEASKSFERIEAAYRDSTERNREAALQRSPVPRLATTMQTRQT